MTRVKISACIIACIILFSVFGIFTIDSKTQKVIDLLDRTRDIYNQGRIGEALVLADELNDEWESYQTIAGIFVRNEKISAVQNSMSRLRPLIENENDELGAEFESAKSSLEWIIEGEIPKISNVL